MPFGYGGYGGGGRGWSPRLLIGIVIALVGVVGYFTKTQKNPVTGEAQRVNLSVGQEIALGVQAAPQMARQMGGVLPATDPRVRLVKETGQRLVQYTEAGKSPYKFDFHLLADPKTINAFALPGGQIFVTLGMYNRLETQAQLAGVLGHEIGHVINRHSAEHMAKGQLGQSLVAAVAVGASDDPRRGMSAAMVASVVNQMTQLKYGRGDETESDTYGLRYMTEAGFNPEGMIGVMKVLKEAAGGGRQPEFMSSHPDPGNRLQRVQEFIARNYPNGIPPTLSNGVRLK